MVDTLEDLYSKEQTIAKSYFKWKQSLTSFEEGGEDYEKIQKLIKEKREELTGLSFEIGQRLNEEILHSN